MNNYLEVKTLEAFRHLEGHPFMTVDVAMHSILGSGVDLTLPQEEYLRNVLERLQDDGYKLGTAEAMGWI